MKYFYVYYKSGCVGRCMFSSLDKAYNFYKNLDLISQISFIKEI